MLTMLMLINTASGQIRKKVLLIGMDGCRADALQLARTPVLDKVISEGYSCMEARTVVPTMSGPGWASMLTGVWYTRHGVKGNLFIGNKLNEHVHFFNYLKGSRKKTYTVSISHWAPINDKIIDKVDYKISPKTDEKVAEEAIKLFKNKNPDAVFLHFDDIDHAGHFTGFSPGNKKYIAAIEKVDSLIGKVLKALKSRKQFKNEDWLILFSPDHGGINKTHGGGTEVERNTFIIASANKIAHPTAKIIKTEIPQKEYLQFNKKEEQITLPPLKEITESEWSFEMTIKIEKWASGASLINNEVFSIKTDGKDGNTWILRTGDNKVKVQGDSINDNKWHKLQLSFSKEGILYLYQDDRIVGIAKTGNISGGWEDSTTFNANEKKNIKWTLGDLNIWPVNKQNTRGSFNDVKTEKQRSNPVIKKIYNFSQLSSKQKINKKLPLIETTENHYYESFKNYPEMVDIVPTIILHMGIKKAEEIIKNKLEGKALNIWN